LFQFRDHWVFLTIAAQMTMTRNIFVADERRMWMRTGDHTVVFDRDPAFIRFLAAPGGSVLRILRIWVADSETDSSDIHHYLGSVRRCECGGWMSHRELRRLFRRATATARRVGENADLFRARLSGFLREYFSKG
jgi:hypothetical protein